LTNQNHGAFLQVTAISGPGNHGKKDYVRNWGDKVSNNGLISSQAMVRDDHWHQNDEDEVEAHLESGEGQKSHWEVFRSPEILEADGLGLPQSWCVFNFLK
jgi:hypothetical protein